MGTARIAGIALIVAGALSLLYGGFSYTKESTAAKIGPVELKVAQKETVNIPVWAGLAAAVGGVLVLVAVGRK